MNYIICTIKTWNQLAAFQLTEKETRNGNDIFLCCNKEDLTIENVNKIQPRMIFFPHWSWKIPENIYNTYECVGFHMTDLPYGRGGSPLQNLIIRDVGKTRITAFRITSEMDAGPVYLKSEEVKLVGEAESIYIKCSDIVFSEMIPEIMKGIYVPDPQCGEMVLFKRRNASESNISTVDSIKKLYDLIRMLDAEGYPPAFLEFGNFRMEFTRPSLKSSGSGYHVIADAKITVK